MSWKIKEKFCRKQMEKLQEKLQERKCVRLCVTKWMNLFVEKVVYLNLKIFVVERN